MTAKQAYEIFFGKNSNVNNENDIRRVTKRSTLNKTYKILIKKFHPDKAQYNNISETLAENISQEINEAYDIITSCLKNKNYYHRGVNIPLAYDAYLDFLKEAQQKDKEKYLKQLEDAKDVFCFNLEKLRITYINETLPLIQDDIDLETFLTIVRKYYQKRQALTERLKECEKIYQKALEYVNNNKVSDDLFNQMLKDIAGAYYEELLNPIKFEQVKNWQFRGKRNESADKRETSILNAKDFYIQRVLEIKIAYIIEKNLELKVTLEQCSKELVTRTTNLERIITLEKYFNEILKQGVKIDDCQQLFDKYLEKLKNLDILHANPDDIKDISEWVKSLQTGEYQAAIQLSKDKEKFLKMYETYKQSADDVEQSKNAITKEFNHLNSLLINEIRSSYILLTAVAFKLENNQTNADMNILKQINALIERVRKVLEHEETAVATILELKEDLSFFIEKYQISNNPRTESHFKTQKELIEEQQEKERLEEIRRKIETYYETFIKMYIRFDIECFDYVHETYKTYSIFKKNKGNVERAYKEMLEYHANLSLRERMEFEDIRKSDDNTYKEIIIDKLFQILKSCSNMYQKTTRKVEIPTEFVILGIINFNNSDDEDTSAKKMILSEKSIADLYQLLELALDLEKHVKIEVETSSLPNNFRRKHH